MTDVEHLDVEDLLQLVRQAEIGPVTDIGLLSSAAARPQASAFGQDAYPTLHEKAAALLHSIVRNHPLVDGNKRLGWLACTVLLDLHGVDVPLGDDEAYDLVIAIAEGRLDVPEIAEALSGSAEGDAAKGPGV